jgi:hypothetical protein
VAGRKVGDSPLAGIEDVQVQKGVEGTLYSRSALTIQCSSVSRVPFSLPNELRNQAHLFATELDTAA